MKSITVEAFYEDMTGHIPEEISREIGYAERMICTVKVRWRGPAQCSW